MSITKIQKEMLNKKCPACREGQLRIVAREDEDHETCLWCDTCDCSIDSNGGCIL